MSEFNSCSHLIENEDFLKFKQKYNELLISRKDPFEEMLNFQLKLQKDLNGKLSYLNPDPSELKTIGEKIDWMRKNKDAVDDEFRELLTSFGGMSNGEKNASAAWKTWKQKHKEIRETEFNSLDKNDRTEVLFELIDIWHFIMNMFLGLNMTSEEIFILYMIKNKENLRRYETGY